MGILLYDIEVSFGIQTCHYTVIKFKAIWYVCTYSAERVSVFVRGCCVFIRWRLVEVLGIMYRENKSKQNVYEN